MAVLTSQAERSGSLRWVKPSMTRLATCPGAGAVSQLSTGANSQAGGLLVPPPRRYFRYWTASRQMVPAAPASRPPVTAARGVSGCLRERMAGLRPGLCGFRARARPGRSSPLPPAGADLQEEREHVQDVQEDRRGQERRGGGVGVGAQPLEVEHGEPGEDDQAED